MQLDKTSYYDLSIFNRDEEFSLFHRLDFTTTAGGREHLRHLFSNPLQNIQEITNRQAALQFLIEHEDSWPSNITNGTIVVVENYMDAQIEPIGNTEGLALYIQAVINKTLYAPDFGFIKFSFAQLINLLKGFRALINGYNKENTPKILKFLVFCYPKNTFNETLLPEAKDKLLWEFPQYSLGDWKKSYVVSST